MERGELKLVKWWRLFRRAYAPYRTQIIVLTVLGFVGGVLEAVGVNTIIPLFSLVDTGTAAPSDAVSRFIVDVLAFFGLDSRIRWFLLFIAVLFLVRAAMLFGSKYLSVKIMADYERREREEALCLLLSSTWPHLATHKLGHLNEVMLNDISRSSGNLYHFGSLIVALSGAFVYSLLIINISLPVTAATVLFGAALLLFFQPILTRYRRLSGRIVKLYKKLSHFISESLVGMKTIKANRFGERILSRGMRSFENLAAARVRTEALRSLTLVLPQSFAVFFVLGTFAILYKTQSFNFAAFALVIYAVNRVFGSIQQIQSELQEFNSRLPHLMHVLEYKEAARGNQEADAGFLPFSFERILEFRGVCFRYGGDKKDVLSGVNFSVPRGALVGVIGPSGAGKTTIVDGILRLLAPQSGGIILDGAPIQSIRLSLWRDKVGYVPQEPFILNDTVEENIRFYDAKLPREALFAAAKEAHLSEFVERQPDKWHTVVGERGARLSGGERQRLALARILARKPEILILDEATSALDAESEQLVKTTLHELKGCITIIVIAHRLSTVRDADRLIIVEGGTVSEEGSPRELLEKKTSYFSRVYQLT